MQTGSSGDRIVFWKQFTMSIKEIVKLKQADNPMVKRMLSANSVGETHLIVLSDTSTLPC